MAAAAALNRSPVDRRGHRKRTAIRGPPVDERENKIRRRRTGRKYILAPPPPLQLFPIVFAGLVGVVFVVQAIMSGNPLPWGIAAGVCLFVIGYFVAMAYMPVKRYRENPEP